MVLICGHKIAKIAKNIAKKIREPTSRYSRLCFSIPVPPLAHSEIGAIRHLGRNWWD